MTEEIMDQKIIDETTSMYDTLEDFGLSSYEARAFYTMLNLSFSTAREISHKSNVPFGRIYDVLGSLEDKELIEKQNSRPKRFTVKEPKFAVNNLLIRKKNDLESLTLRAKNLEDHLAKLYTRKPEEGLFWSVAVDPESINRLIWKMSEAEEELLMYVDTQIRAVKGSTSTEAAQALIMALNELMGKGVNIKVILGGVTDEAEMENLMMMLTDYPELSQFPFRIISHLANTFDVIDGEKVLLKISNPVNPAEYFSAIYVWQKKFANELRMKFLQMWEEAEETRS
jgi:sugar-specific transcriptional regulator TrmB